MRRRIILATGLALAAVPSASVVAQDKLTVYTYDSFVSEWGPGPQIETAFEAHCGCDLEFVAVDDGVAILSRVRLEGDRTPADVLLGLDMNLLADARATGLVAPHNLDLPADALPIDWQDETFVPYDWGYFAFVYDSEVLETPPASLRELFFESDVEVIIEDPRTSTPGLGLLLWAQDVLGDEAADGWAAFRPRIVTVTRGWSEAYGLFLEGEAPMVLSYTTSPAYHLTVDDVDRYRAAAFEEGHYLQIEVAAMTTATRNSALAQRFLTFLTTAEAQALLPQTNWMYPAFPVEDGIPDSFETLIAPTRALLIDSATVAAQRGTWTDDWLSAMSR